jgi:hypothetical protein
MRPRPYTSRVAITDQWLSAPRAGKASPEGLLGFLEGDGGFLVNIRNKQLTAKGLPYIYCNLNINQKEREILDRIQYFLGKGNVNPKNKKDLSKGFSYDIGKLTDIQSLITLLDNMEFKSKHKYHDYVIWKTVIDMISKGEHLEAETHQRIVELSKTMHIYGKIK